MHTGKIWKKYYLFSFISFSSSLPSSFPLFFLSSILLSFLPSFFLSFQTKNIPSFTLKNFRDVPRLSLQDIQQHTETACHTFNPKGSYPCLLATHRVFLHSLCGEMWLCWEDCPGLVELRPVYGEEMQGMGLMQRKARELWIEHKGSALGKTILGMGGKGSDL